MKVHLGLERSRAQLGAIDSAGQAIVFEIESTSLQDTFRKLQNARYWIIQMFLLWVKSGVPICNLIMIHKASNLIAPSLNV